MGIIKTEAVILKCDNYRETSKLVTFFSKQHGKLRGIAKGVRSAKTKWGGVLQSMAYVNIMYYFKENRTLHLVSSAEHVNPLGKIYDDFDKLRIGYRIIEIINKTTVENHQNEQLFGLLVKSLENLSIATKNYVNVLFNYKFELAKLLGFGINIGEILGLNDNSNSDGSTGRNIAKDNQNQYFYNTRFSKGDIKALSLISGGNFNSLMSFNISASQEESIEKFFDSYFKSHFENINISNTKKVFNSTNINTKQKAKETFYR